MSQDRAQPTALLPATLILNAVATSAAVHAQGTGGASQDGLNPVVVTGCAGMEAAQRAGRKASAPSRALGIPQEGFSAAGMQEDGLPIHGRNHNLSFVCRC